MLLDGLRTILDIAAIAWLEAELAQTRAAFIVISHDRAFLRAAWRGRRSGSIVARLRRMDRPFAEFEDWRDEIWAQEDVARHKLDRKIKEEARWAVEGISARRKRNQGRVRELGNMRETRAAMIAREGGAALALDRGPRAASGVIEARGYLAQLWRPRDRRAAGPARAARRTGWPCGAQRRGQDTLLNMLIGAEAPDTGEVTLGTGLELAVFDQSARRSIPPGRCGRA